MIRLIRPARRPGAVEGESDQWGVQIVADEGNSWITRKQALERAQALIPLRETESDAQYYIEAFIEAADNARREEFGAGYSSESKEALLRLPPAAR